jgi:hypothetical protein
VQKYPTLVITTPGGVILGYQEGFVEAPALHEQMHGALLAVSTPDWMVRDLKAAAEAQEKGEYARAFALPRDRIDDGKDRPETRKETRARRGRRRAAAHASCARSSRPRGRWSRC